MQLTWLAERPWVMSIRVNWYWDCGVCAQSNVNGNSSRMNKNDLWMVTLRNFHKRGCNIIKCREYNLISVRRILGNRTGNKLCRYQSRLSGVSRRKALFLAAAGHPIIYIKRERSKEFDLCAKIPRYGTQVHKIFQRLLYVIR